MKKPITHNQELDAIKNKRKIAPEEARKLLDYHLSTKRNNPDGISLAIETLLHELDVSIFVDECNRNIIGHYERSITKIKNDIKSLKLEDPDTYNSVEAFDKAKELILLIISNTVVE